MRALALLLAAIVIVTAFAAQAGPKDPGDPENPESPVWLPPLLTLQWENDMFAGTDRHYTNGLRLTALFSRANTPKTLDDALQTFSHIDRKSDRNTWFTAGIGQDMYTPGDKRATALIANDRPYAGWLYLSASAHKLARCWTSSDNAPDCLDSVEANIGVVGPAAYGKQVQDFVHKARGIKRFEGWHNQLKNEPGFVMTWERKKRWIFPPASGWGYDLIPNIGASLGNVRSQINAGASMRLGYNIPRDFGAPGAIKPVATVTILQEDRLGGYFFIGMEGRYVGHNIFLDGNTFVRSHSVTRKPWVYDTSQGFALTKGPYRFTVARVFRSKEFEGQDQNTWFSSMTLSVSF